MLSQWFIVPVNPEPWAVGPAGTARGASGIRAYVGPNPQVDNYKKAVASHIQSFYPHVHLVDVECEINFYFSKRLDRYVTASERSHMRHIADATNMQKATEDALQGIVITNDKLVRRVTSEIIDQNPDCEPFIVICVKSPYHAQWQIEIPDEITQSVRQMSDNVFPDLGNLL